ncbi:MAG TPA: hypothetical protein VN673_02665 [Clostridia bacterium]|nr:hypothetical protein [Clostridia bacterium]
MLISLLPSQRLKRVSPRWVFWLVALVTGFGLFQSSAATITNVTAVNVTPTSFSLFWRMSGSTHSVELFADENGMASLAGQLEVSVFPLHTGNPNTESGYFRRQSRLSLQEKTRGMGMALVQVSGCKPGTTYYYRVVSNSGTGTPVVYPETGPLPSVKTQRENTFVVDNQQLMLEVPGVDTSGQVVLVNHPNAAHPLAAVVGDGAGTNQVVFNLNNLFEMSSEGGNFAPLGSQAFAVTAMGPNYSSISAQFMVTFGSEFLVSGGNQVSMGTEFVASGVGSIVFRAQEEGKVPLSFNSSVGITRLDLRLSITPNRLTNLGLKSLAPEVDPALSVVTPQGGSNVLVRLVARAGQAFAGAKQLAEFSFNAVGGQDSAFVPLRLQQIEAVKGDATLVTTLFGQSGRAIIVGTSSLLEAVRAEAGGAQLLLYARPGTICALEYATNLNAPVYWTRIDKLIPVNELVTPCDAPQVQGAQRFYRAVEHTINPPVVQAFKSSDETRNLLIYGEPSRSYAIEYKTELSAGAPWQTLQTNTLVNSFGYVGVGRTNGVIFYRLRRL